MDFLDSIASAALAVEKVFLLRDFVGFSLTDTSKTHKMWWLYFKIKEGKL